MHPITEFFLFFLVSLGVAGVGWGIVVIASRIEHERQERYAERYGKKGLPVPFPKPSDESAIAIADQRTLATASAPFAVTAARPARQRADMCAVAAGVPVVTVRLVLEPLPSQHRPL